MGQTRIQSKVVKVWKEKYRLKGIEISYNRFGVPTWEMRSSNSRFVTYQCAVPIRDITEFDENVDLFNREYPQLLRDEIARLVESYPADRRIKEDSRMFQRAFGRK